MKVEIEAHAEAGLFSRRNAYIREAMRAQGQTCHFAKNAKINKFIQHSRDFICSASGELYGATAHRMPVRPERYVKLPAIQSSSHQVNVIHRIQCTVYEYMRLSPPVSARLSSRIRYR